MEPHGGPNADPLSELIFLRQMVHRLNAALSKYQGSDALNPDSTKSTLPLSGVDVEATWLTNPTLLSPLIQEYEAHLSSLITKVSDLTTQNNDCIENLKSVTEENERLHVELQEVIQQQMQEVESESPSTQVDTTLKNLQLQLELTAKEKDAAVEMNKEAMKTLDSIRQKRATEVTHARSREHIFDETKARNELLQDSNLQMQMAIESLQKENHTLVVTAAQQLKELKVYQDELQNVNQILRENKQNLDELKRTNSTLNKNLHELSQGNADLEHRERLTATQNQQLQSSLVEAESKLARALQTASDAQAQADGLKINLAALEKMNSEIESKEMSYLMQVRDSAQLLDDALLARDSALVREQQKKSELENASAAMETLVHEVADRVKSEVDKVKSQCNANIRRLMDEVQSLELESANLKSEADRAKRAKRAAENELEAMSRERHDTKDQNRMEELQRRTIVAERARDDSLITVQKLEDRIKRGDMEHEDGRLRLLSVNQTLEQRVKRLERETEECQHERLHLLESVNQYKHDNQKLQETARSARLSAVKEFTASKDTIEREKKQLEIRLKSVDETNRASVRQLHKMLADQQRITARWKEESRSACEKYEDKVKDLQSQLSHNRRRCQDLTNRLKSNDDRNEIMAENLPPVEVKMSAEDVKLPDPRLSKLEETNRQLRARLHETEYKLLSATQKLGESQALRNSFTINDLH